MPQCLVSKIIEDPFQFRKSSFHFFLAVAIVVNQRKGTAIVFRINSWKVVFQKLHGFGCIFWCADASALANVDVKIGHDAIFGEEFIIALVVVMALELAVEVQGLFACAVVEKVDVFPAVAVIPLVEVGFEGIYPGIGLGFAVSLDAVDVRVGDLVKKCGCWYPFHCTKTLTAVFGFLVSSKEADGG